MLVPTNMMVSCGLSTITVVTAKRSVPHFDEKKKSRSNCTSTFLERRPHVCTDGLLDNGSICHLFGFTYSIMKRKAIYRFLNDVSLHVDRHTKTKNK